MKIFNSISRLLDSGQLKGIFLFSLIVVCLSYSLSSQSVSQVLDIEGKAIRLAEDRDIQRNGKIKE